MALFSYVRTPWKRLPVLLELVDPFKIAPYDDGMGHGHLFGVVLLSMLGLLGCGAPVYPDAGAPDGPMAPVDLATDLPGDGGSPDVPGDLPLDLSPADVASDIKWCGKDACSIKGSCYNKGDKDKADSCHVCDPELSPLSWAPAPGCVVTLAGDWTTKGFKDSNVNEALFNQPRSVALGPKGALFVADYWNHRVRKIKDGEVTSLAGVILTPSGVAVSSAGDVYVSDFGNNKILRLAGGKVIVHAGSGSKGHKDGAAGAASFNGPQAVAEYNGAVYVADFGNNAVRKILGGQVTTHSGGGKAGYINGDKAKAKFAEPTGVLAAPSGVHVTESGNSTVRLIKGSQVSTLAGCGLQGFKDSAASEAKFYSPWDVAHDGKGAVYVADSQNHRVRQISGGLVTTLAGTGVTGHKDGPLSKAQFNTPRGLVMDSKGYIFVADQDNHAIRVIKP